MVVRVDRDFVIGPRLSPEVDGDHVCEELEVCNSEILELSGCGDREVFVILVIIGSQPRLTLIPTVRWASQICNFTVNGLI